jgi:hypothetical protein
MKMLETEILDIAKPLREDNMNLTDEDLYNYTIIKHNSKEDIGIEIKNSIEINNMFNKYMFFYPTSFLEKVIKEEGKIVVEFDENWNTSTYLINVSDELMDEFRSKYY